MKPLVHSYLARFRDLNGRIRLGLVAGADDPATAELVDLTAVGIAHLRDVFEEREPLELLAQLDLARCPRLPLSRATLLAPVDDQEVWAAGVTYHRSRQARMEESQFGASAYDRVYTAPRPELFFKAVPSKVVGAGAPIGIRRDARWSVPEPELALFFNSSAELMGFTVGNDMSSRDIEGENLLYLAQAKVYSRSCALGPWLRLGVGETDARDWTIRLEIEREGKVAFAGETGIRQIKRSFAELAAYLFRSQEFPSGVVLLTGTGIIPPDEFSLAAGDRVRICVSGIGVLENQVSEV